MATRNEIIDELIIKQFEMSGQYIDTPNLRESVNQWKPMYSMPQDVKVRWLNWGAGFLQQRFGLSLDRAKTEMRMLDEMYGLKTY